MTFADIDRERSWVGRADRSRAREETSTRERILVVDDDASARMALEERLIESGFAISTAPDGEAALAEARRAPPDVVLTDLHVRPIYGGELCQRLHEIDRDLPVIVMTTPSEMPSVMGVLRAGAEDYVTKPLQYDEVLWRVERAIARRIAKNEQGRLRQHTEDLYRTLIESSVREQEHADAEAKQRAHLNALLENLKEGVAIADRSGHIVMINDAARVILGATDDDVRRGDPFQSQEFYDPDGAALPIEHRPLVRALRGEQFTDYEVLRAQPNGDRRRIVSTGTSVRDDKGDVALAIVVFRDLTELRRLEQQRDEFLALISHDLRNPLSGILMFVAALKRSVAKRGTAEDVDLAERAERNIMRMSAMIEELTETTSLESPEVALRLEACDLRDIVASAVDGMDDARARRVEIEAEFDEASAYVVFGDPPRLERVVTNLITNALKYSLESSVVIARFARHGSDVHLDVVDRGIGIEPESMKMLFDRYYRTTGGRARASGQGLGLYIARLIVEAHGGRIDVSSEVGKGSTFRLILPSHAALPPQSNREAVTGHGPACSRPGAGGSGPAPPSKDVASSSLDANAFPPRWR
jgi:PAS domain S-box-containing protein